VDSEWALLEFRPGRYVKVTASGEVLGRPTDEEIKAWFASRGWGIDSTEGSLSLELGPPAEPAEDAPQTVTLPQPPETPVPDQVQSTTGVVRDGSQPVPTPMPPSAADSLSHGAEEVPVMAMPEPEVPSEATPSEPEPQTQLRGADADMSEAAPVQVDGVSAADSQDYERPRPEPEAREIGIGLASELPTVELEPLLGDSVVLPYDASERSPAPVRGPTEAVSPLTPTQDVDIPEQLEWQEAGPELPPSRAAPAPDEAPAVDGTGRWLWVDPRQEGGYGQATYDVAAFLGRAVELFEGKPWAGGKNPSRLAVHPDHITEDLESAAEALGLEVLGDARVMGGTYMLGLGDRHGND
jgi:hypothetical protein